MTDTLASLVLAFVPVLGRALLHFLWQGALIGLVAAWLLHALRGARPQARYAVACFALFACALAPVLDVAWQLARVSEVATSVIAAPAPVAMASLGTATQAITQAWNLDDALPLIVSIWASGACALLLRMALGVWWIQRLCRAPQDSLAATWQARLDALASRFGIKYPVALRLVGAIDSPASVGWWRPVVLLPGALLARMPVELVEALLAHELAHIRRHDYLVNLLQSAVEALLFHHPVTWWLSHRIRIEREQVADALAAEAIGEPRRLALALSELSDSLAPNAPTERLPSLALAAHGGQLMSRIEHLVRPALRRNGGGRIAFPLLGLAAACIALIAHAQAGGNAAPAAATPAPASLPMPAPAPQVVPEATPANSSVVVGKPQSVARSDSRDVDAGRLSYAIVRKDSDSMTMSGDTRDIDGIKAIRQGMDRDFLWVRKDGKSWVITDASILARARQAWAPMEPLDRQMEALDAQMEVHDQRMEALDAQMEKLSAQQEDSPEMEAASGRMEKLGRQQEALARRQEALSGQMERADEATQDRLAREMDALSAQQDALARRMDAESQVMDTESARMQRNAQPMEALARQMDEAGKPMEALGKQMDALGKRIDAMSEQAERETLQLIDEAMAKGLAQPAPVRQ